MIYLIVGAVWVAAVVAIVWGRHQLRASEPHREERWHPSSGLPQPESQRLPAYSFMWCPECDVLVRTPTAESSALVMINHARLHSQMLLTVAEAEQVLKGEL